MVFMISGKAESGKTTLAEALSIKLADFGVASYIIPFASEVKAVAKSMGWDGNKDKKGRDFLQLIGDGGRNYDPDMWIKKEYTNIEYMRTLLQDESLPIIIDDVRYTNEMIKMKEKYENVITIRIERPNHQSSLTPEQKMNKSETDLDNYDDFDFIFINDGDIEQLKDFATQILKGGPIVETD